MQPQLLKIFMEVLKGYYNFKLNMVIHIIYVANVTCKYKLQFYCECDKLSSVKSLPDHQITPHVKMGYEGLQSRPEVWSCGGEGSYGVTWGEGSTELGGVMGLDGVTELGWSCGVRWRRVWRCGDAEVWSHGIRCRV